MIKKLIKYGIRLPHKLLISLFFVYEKILDFLVSSSLALYGRESFLLRIDNEKRKIQHKTKNSDISFYLYTPNRLCLLRQETFSSKEPELLEWIEEFGDNGPLFDIGANIGIYSIYYALSKPGNVYSFEPSVFNLRQLAKNINIISLSEKIKIIPNPISNDTSIEPFINSNTTEGGALNAFGVEYGYDGKKIENEVQYSVLGFSLDDLIQKKIIEELPSLIKIDVDGIEHLILSGAKATISHESCKSILVEVNDDFAKQSEEVGKILSNAGFKFREKRQWEDSSEEFGRTYNQIWVKE